MPTRTNPATNDPIEDPAAAEGNTHPVTITPELTQARSVRYSIGDGSVLHRKLAAIAADLKRLEKGGRNKDQGYSFLSTDDILDAVRSKLGAVGITLIQEHHDTIEVEDHQTRSGGTMRSVRIAFRFILTDGESGEREEYIFHGVGADTGDKWYSKASTFALKYFILRLLLISAGDDEPDAETYERGSRQAPKQETAKEWRPTTRQNDRVWAIANSKGIETDLARRIIWACTGGVTEHSNEIPTREKYDLVCSTLEGWADEMSDKLVEFELKHPRLTEETSPASDLPTDETPAGDDPVDDDIPF